MFCVRCAVFYALAMLAGCSYQGPSLAGQPGLQWQVISFYGDRATERDSSCNSPADALHHRDPCRRRYSGAGGHGPALHLGRRERRVDMPHGGSNILCQGWGERTFTFARNTDGTLGVLDMSGPQRRA